MLPPLVHSSLTDEIWAPSSDIRAWPGLLRCIDRHPDLGAERTRTGVAHAAWADGHPAPGTLVIRPWSGGPWAVRLIP